METVLKTISKDQFSSALYEATKEAYRPKDSLSGWFYAIFDDYTISDCVSQNTYFPKDNILTSVNVWGNDIDSSYFDIQNYSEEERIEILKYNGLVKKGWKRQLTKRNINELAIPWSLINTDDIYSSICLEIERLESEGYTFEK